MGNKMSRRTKRLELPTNYFKSNSCYRYTDKLLMNLKFCKAHSQTHFFKGNLCHSYKGVKLTATAAPKLNTKDPSISPPILLTIRS